MQQMPHLDGKSVALWIPHKLLAGVMWFYADLLQLGHHPAVDSRPLKGRESEYLPTTVGLIKNSMWNNPHSVLAGWLHEFLFAFFFFIGILLLGWIVLMLLPSPLVRSKEPPSYSIFYYHSYSCCVLFLFAAFFNGSPGTHAPQNCVCYPLV